MTFDRCVWSRAIAIVMFGTVTVCVAGPPSLPLETGVKVYRAATPAAPPMPMQMRTGARPAPAPTTPAAKYPQYRIGNLPNEQPKVENAANSAIRFILNLPTELLLAEARITIDDVPFAMVRQKRVERILRELKVGKDITTGLGNDPDKVAQPTEVATTEQTASNIADRLRHSMELTGETPSAKEIDWLISQWFDGPAILPLNGNFQRFRANQRPEFVILDRNRDGTISAEEMQVADKSLWECDLNQDGIIQFMEIAVAAADPRVVTTEVDPGELIVFLPEGECTTEACQRLGLAKRSGSDAASVAIGRFDMNGNGQLDVDEFDALRKRIPDLSLTIAFNSTNPDKSKIGVASVGDDFREAIKHAASDATGITFTFKGTPVLLGAVQMQPSDQISIGAVNDGYPILPALDLNDDGRLTVRELRGLLNTLSSFDLNRDGALTLDEVRSPIRLCIGLGPNVHRELIGVRTLHQKATVAPIAGPEWFVRMDRNKDNDLIRSEFPGTDEQFQALDSDRDGLVSAAEALQFDKQADDAKENERQPDAN